MSEQLSHPAFGAPRPSSDRLFFAIRPDMEAAMRIDRLARSLRGKHGLKGKPLGVERFHVTLYYVGDFSGLPQGVIEAAREAAQALTAIAPFVLGFDRVASFSRRPRNMPLVLLGGDPLLALKRFQLALATAMENAGIGRGAGAHYTPHLTLLYDDRYVADKMIEPIAWSAGEFCLMRSLIGRGRHEALWCLPLHG